MSHHPYIMPDGRPLGQFLHELQTEPPKGSKSQSTRRNKKAERSGGWSTGKSAFRGGVAGGAGGDQEQEHSNKLGRDRRRRFLNEKILRDMAGAMNASDMEALFKPVPFGDTGHRSAITQAATPAMVPVWDVFRNIDEDKQNVTLQKWEAAVRSQKRGDPESAAVDSTADHSGLAALKSWARVPRKAREAMKRCRPEVVEVLEEPLLEFLDASAAAGEAREKDAGSGSSAREEGEPLELEVSDAYQRLMTHGLAAFHSLQSYTTDGGLTFVKLVRGCSCRGCPQITCADICFSLGEGPAGGLTARTLHSHWKRMHVGTDADSEASFVIV